MDAVLVSGANCGRNIGLKWEGPSRRYNHRGAAYHGPAPHAGYVCRRCRVPGHFIQHCPTNDDPRFDFRKAATSVVSPAPAEPVDDDGVPSDLHCKICEKVMVDAVVTSKCCFSSFCDRCIKTQIISSSKCACGAQGRVDDLIPNLVLRTTISNILVARASNASGEKTENSVSSNPVAETQNPTASQHSQVSSKKGAAAASEDSDRSESASNPAAAPEPGKKEQETTDTAGARAANHAGHNYGSYDDVPQFAPACYDPGLFGGMPPWSVDPSMYHAYGGMAYAYGGSSSYLMGPQQHVDAMGNNMTAPYGYHGERQDSRKRRGCDDQRQHDRSFKRRCGGSRSQVALVLT